MFGFAGTPLQLVHDSRNARLYSTFALKGSILGDPLVDILFNFLMASILDLIEQRLVEAELVHVMPNVNDQDAVACSFLAAASVVAPGVSMLDAAYCDDCVFMQNDADPLRLIQKTKQTMAIVRDTFAEFCMQLNFKPGKTECILKFRGHKSKEALQQIYDDGSAIAVPNELHKSVDILRVVRF